MQKEEASLFSLLHLQEQARTRAKTCRAAPTDAEEGIDGITLTGEFRNFDFPSKIGRSDVYDI